MLEILGGVIKFLFSGIVFIISLIFSLVVLIIQGIPLYKMAKTTGLNNAWLAFIPLGNIHIMLNLPKNELKVLGIKFDRNTALFKIILILFVLSLPITIFANSKLWFISTIFSCISYIFGLILSYRLIKDILDTYSSGNTILWALIGMFIPIVQIILLYLIMNRVPIGGSYPINNLGGYYE